MHATGKTYINERIYYFSVFPRLHSTYVVSIPSQLKVPSNLIYTACLGH